MEYSISAEYWNSGEGGLQLQSPVSLETHRDSSCASETSSLWAVGADSVISAQDPLYNKVSSLVVITPRIESAAIHHEIILSRLSPVGGGTERKSTNIKNIYSVIENASICTSNYKKKWLPQRLYNEEVVGDQELDVAMADHELDAAVENQELDVAMADHEVDAAVENQELDVAMENQELDVAVENRELDVAVENQELDVAMADHEVDAAVENQELDVAMENQELDVAVENRELDVAVADEEVHV